MTQPPGIQMPNKCKDVTRPLFDLSIGLGLPLLVAGPLYYVVQQSRFVISEELGCGSTVDGSGLSIILVQSWSILLPLTSATFYCPKIIAMFYRHRKEVNSFLRSHSFAIGCLDILITLPLGILNLSVSIGTNPHMPFYSGWSAVHHSWDPTSIPASEWKAGFWGRFNITYDLWLYFSFCVAVFAIFGLSGEARATYRRWLWMTARPIGIKKTDSDIGEMVFGSRPRDTERSRATMTFSTTSYTGTHTFFNASGQEECLSSRDADTMSVGKGVGPENSERANGMGHIDMVNTV